MFGQDNPQDQNSPWLNNNSGQFNAPAPQQDQPQVDPGQHNTAAVVEPVVPQQDQPAPSSDNAPHEHATAPAGAPTEELLQIKQDALQQLSPLVNQLELAPEEKFRTTMMMIQAADDHSLLSQAYDIAKQITDEKARAQALLDVINEINYFTQQQKD